MRKTFLTLGLTGLVFLGGTSLQGCYGSFGLTKKVYNWNGSIGNKWLKSLLFFVMATMVPVYGITLFVDAIALNLIEFWTGSNPVSANQTSMDKTYADGTKVHADRLSDGRLSVKITAPSGLERSFVLTHEIDGISASDVQGGFMAKVAQTDAGMVIVHPQAAQTALAR
jgi:hypothetical protein